MKLYNTPSKLSNPNNSYLHLSPGLESQINRLSGSCISAELPPHCVNAGPQKFLSTFTSKAV